MTPASVTFTTNAIVAISDTLRWAFFFPTTRVMSTVEAVPMAERAMVMMLSICSAFPTAAAGSVPKGDSMTWFTLPTMICMNSSMNKGIEKLKPQLYVAGGCVVGRRPTPGPLLCRTRGAVGGDGRPNRFSRQRPRGRLPGHTASSSRGQRLSRPRRLAWQAMHLLLRGLARGRPCEDGRQREDGRYSARAKIDAPGRGLQISPAMWWRATAGCTTVARRRAPTARGRTAPTGFRWFVAHMLGFLLPDLVRKGRSFA